MSLIPNENLRHRSDYPGDDCQRHIDEIENLKAANKGLVEALEKIADTDPDAGTGWFHEIAQEALTKHKASMGEK